jgi:hypothetical protein
MGLINARAGRITITFMKGSHIAETVQVSDLPLPAGRHNNVKLKYK